LGTYLPRPRRGLKECAYRVLVANFGKTIEKYATWPTNC
jgi:hypothetical protein